MLPSYGLLIALYMPYSILNAVLTESQWQDTTACCAVSCSVNIWEIEVWWLLSSWHQGSETLLSIERVYCDGTLKNANTSTATLLSSRTLLHCLFTSPFFSPFQQSLLSNESYAPPPLVGFVRTRQKFTTLHSNKIEVRRLAALPFCYAELKYGSICFSN